MKTLQQKLRQLRSWQHLTLASCAETAILSTKQMGAIEVEGGRWKRDRIADEALLIRFSHAYGIVPNLLKAWLEEEVEWRMCAHDGDPATLPRVSQYLYRPLPEAAHNLFRDGFCVLDCETTGKDPHANTEICEITILDTDGVVLLNTLVKPIASIPSGVTDLHGITNEIVATAPTFQEIGPEIARLVNGQVVVIFNAGYDAWLLDRLFIENSIDMPDFQAWCLMLAYAEHHKAPGKFFGNYAWQSLGAACEQQEVEQQEKAHRSLADTTATWRLLQKLALQYDNQNLGEKS